MKKPAILVLVVILSGCASLGANSNTSAIALARLAGVAAEIYMPGSMTALQEVCTASGVRDRDLMVKALQEVWTEADKQKATVVVESLNDLVGATGIVDAKPTEKNLSTWQEVLGAMCCATGKCANQ